MHAVVGARLHCIIHASSSTHALLLQAYTSAAYNAKQHTACHGQQSYSPKAAKLYQHSVCSVHCLCELPDEAAAAAADESPPLEEAAAAAALES